MGFCITQYCDLDKILNNCSVSTSVLQNQTSEKLYSKSVVIQFTRTFTNFINRLHLNELALNIPPSPFLSGHPDDKVVRGRGGLQRDGDGAAGAQPGGSVQLLLSEVQPEDSPAAGRPDGKREDDWEAPAVEWCGNES